MLAKLNASIATGVPLALAAIIEGEPRSGILAVGSQRGNFICIIHLKLADELSCIQNIVKYTTKLTNDYENCTLLLI